ncbi:MAG TPA: gephyrin-like molybdotransferase Glp [Xanthobacteraceae bacterium]|nr:gephyrin-like molybdotransferase Glp [Xanthobacteraceae bacterium]
MAQLSNDCFAHGGALLPVDEAARLMAEHVPSVADAQPVTLADAAGRILAEDLIAPIALPAFDNSAVDGYAVRNADVAHEGETRLRVVDRVFAGSPAERVVGAGEAVHIFTGAPMPAGADTVYMQEDSKAEGDAVIVPAGLKIGANRRLAGEDIKAGALALPAGRRLQPQDVALAAALGVEMLSVRRRLRVALISTGNEIVEPGNPLPAFGLYDSNRFLLMGLLRKLGVEVSDLGILPDDPAALVSAIEGAAATHDLVLSTGGVSTGEADHVKTAVEKLGRLMFWRLAIKPGRPVAMGVIGGKAFVGLPGNPVAVFVTFVHVVRPLILRLAGGSMEPTQALPVRAAFSYRKKKGRREYVRVRLRPGGDGTLEAVKHPQEGAGIITSLTETDGLAELVEDRTTVEPDSSVGFLSYRLLID